MKILQLNIWTGRIKGALLDFLRNNDFDVICLQEAVWSNRDDIIENFSASIRQISEASGLSNISVSSNWQMRFLDDGLVDQGNVILSREKVISEKIESVYGERTFIKSIKDFSDHEYTLQIVRLASGLTVVNHHGYWLADPLGDKTTVEAMKKVASYIKKINGPLVMCGDLNIVHASPAMRELDFLRDLTEEYGVTNTLAGLKFNGKVACDHILVNDKITVKDFKVLDRVVSDHKGLVAEINFE